MKDSIRQSIDIEKNKLIKDSIEIIVKYNQGLINDELKLTSRSIIQSIKNFRLKLGANKATEFLETNLNWTKGFDHIIDELSKIK